MSHFDSQGILPGGCIHPGPFGHAPDHGPSFPHGPVHTGTTTPEGTHGGTVTHTDYGNGHWTDVHRNSQGSVTWIQDDKGTYGMGLNIPQHQNSGSGNMDIFGTH